MDPVVSFVLDLIRSRARAISEDVIARGVDLIRARLEGRTTDAEIMEWLREAQGAVHPRAPLGPEEVPG